MTRGQPVNNALVCQRLIQPCFLKALFKIQGARRTLRQTVQLRPQKGPNHRHMRRVRIRLGRKRHHLGFRFPHVQQLLHHLLVPLVMRDSRVDLPLRQGVLLFYFLLDVCAPLRSRCKPAEAMRRGAVTRQLDEARICRRSSSSSFTRLAPHAALACASSI